MRRQQFLQRVPTYQEDPSFYAERVVGTVPNVLKRVYTENQTECGDGMYTGFDITVNVPYQPLQLTHMKFGNQPSVSFGEFIRLTSGTHTFVNNGLIVQKSSTGFVRFLGTYGGTDVVYSSQYDKWYYEYGSQEPNSGLEVLSNSLSVFWVSTASSDYIKNFVQFFKIAAFGW